MSVQGEGLSYTSISGFVWKLSQLSRKYISQSPLMTSVMNTVKTDVDRDCFRNVFIFSTSPEVASVDLC